jgi:hypothetical protein
LINGKKDEVIYGHVIVPPGRLTEQHFGIGTSLKEMIPKMKVLA